MEPNTPQPRKWYTKKRYLIPIGFFGLVALAAANGTPSAPTAQVQGSAYSATVIQSASTATPPVQAPIVTPPAPPTPSTPTVYAAPAANAPQQQEGENDLLSNDNQYTNVDGNTVHSPAYSENDEAPDGATAECGDGTYSFSQHRSGTCSHHGGVEEWLD